ncbi:hypothetical protein RI367_007240 [Sorochytrium milnesiophthora]
MSVDGIMVAVSKHQYPVIKYVDTTAGIAVENLETKKLNVASRKFSHTLDAILKKLVEIQSDHHNVVNANSAALKDICDKVTGVETKLAGVEARLVSVEANVTQQGIDQAKHGLVLSGLQAVLTTDRKIHGGLTIDPSPAAGAVLQNGICHHLFSNLFS